MLKPFFTSSSLFKLPSSEPAIEQHEEAKEEECEVKEYSSFEKVFQRQISKLKTVKGMAPSKKDNGFLSIEKVKGG